MFAYLKIVAKALGKVGVRGLFHGAVPGAGFVFELAEEIVRQYREHHRQQAVERMRADLEQVLQAQLQQVREAARQVVQEVLAHLSPEERRKIEQYLTQLPMYARQSLKRPEDPRGRTVPREVNLNNATEVAMILPPRLPRFEPGQTVPHAPQWQLVELLGSGGFGEVWLARHEFLPEQRAFKFCLDEQARQRLLRHEGQIVAQVLAASQSMRTDTHGIVRLLDACLQGDAPWLAYEYVEGGDLSAVVARQAQLPPSERGRRAIQTLQALAEVIGRLHRLNPPVIHRDLKPANILVKIVEGRDKKRMVLRVTDFGISQIAAERSLEEATRWTRMGTLGVTLQLRGAFTPVYSSPQQMRGERPNVRDDVYSLGIISWQLLTGDLRRGKPGGREFRRVCQECGVPEGVAEVLERCWDDEPSERPRDAAELAASLQLEESKPTPTKTPDCKQAAIQSVSEVIEEYNLDRYNQLLSKIYNEKYEAKNPLSFYISIHVILLILSLPLFPICFYIQVIWILYIINDYRTSRKLCKIFYRCPLCFSEDIVYDIRCLKLPISYISCIECNSQWILRLGFFSYLNLKNVGRLVRMNEIDPPQTTSLNIWVEWAQKRFREKFGGS